MAQKNKYAYLAKNTILFTISSFGSKLLVFLLVPLYTSILSTEDYGIADLITTTSTLLIYILTINIADAVLRFTIERKDNQEQYLNFGLIVLSISSCVLAVALAIAQHFDIFSWPSYCYVFLFLEFFVLALYQILSNFLRGIDEVKAVAISGIITTVVTVFFNIILLVLMKCGVFGYLLSMVAGTLVSSIYCLIKIRNRIFLVFRNKCNKPEKRAMCRYSLPLIFNNVSWWMNTSLDKYFLTWMCGASVNGIYAVAQKIPTIISVFHSIFSQAWNLSAIKEFDKDDKDGFFANTYSMYNALLVLICSGLILLNVPLAKILFAKDFFIAWKYSSVLLISIVFSSLGGFLGSIFTAVKDTKIFAVSTVVSAAINCILNGAFIPIWGTMGAAVATLISFCMIWIIRLICTKKYIIWRFNLLRDIVAYLLLIAQAVIEHIDGHCYEGQIVIFLFLMFWYRMHVKKGITLILSKTLKKKGEGTR